MKRDTGQLPRAPTTEEWGIIARDYRTLYAEWWHTKKGER